MASGISKLDYLKKYMDKGDQKKKKKRVKNVQSKIKIIDNQISFKDIANESDEEEISKYDLVEEKPLLFTDDGSTVITKEFAAEQDHRKARWAPLNSDSKSLTKSNDNDRHVQRRKRYNSDDSDVSLLFKQTHDNSDSDISPPRIKKQRHDSENSDLSPVRKGECSDIDLSPIRNRRNRKDSVDSDLSPPRPNGCSLSKKKGSVRREQSPVVMISSKKSGLQSGHELQIENEKNKKHEKEKFKKLDKSVSGRNADTIYRDHKSGQKIDIKFEELKKRKEEEKKMIENEKYSEWGKGVVQTKNQQLQLQEHLVEMEKPLARYKNDKDLDVLLKNKVREDDPMMEYITKSKDKNKPQKLRYSGPTPAPNRFNIFPGYRYDGVDRSNGFEKRRFIEISKRKSLESERYKWSVENM